MMNDNNLTESTIDSVSNRCLCACMVYKIDVVHGLSMQTMRVTEEFVHDFVHLYKSNVP